LIPMWEDDGRRKMIKSEDEYGAVCRAEPQDRASSFFFWSCSCTSSPCRYRPSGRSGGSTSVQRLELRFLGPGATGPSTFFVSASLFWPLFRIPGRAAPFSYQSYPILGQNGNDEGKEKCKTQVSSFSTGSLGPAKDLPRRLAKSAAGATGELTTDIPLQQKNAERNPKWLA
jgi:hypothetical protein